jgi:2,3-bisphosphoglycerate-dependent phosphoglycerate mutase
MTTTLILIRHGETSWNAIKRIQGFTDIPLNEVGLRQADDLGERFERLSAAEQAGSDPAKATELARSTGSIRLSGAIEPAKSAEADSLIAALADADGAASFAAKPITMVYTSDLIRAQQTAAPLAKALGLTPVIDPNVRERNYGLFEGMSPEEIAARFPDEYAHWQTRDPEFRPGPGESQRMFHDRVVTALRAIASKHPGERVVVVAHGGVLDNARRHAQSLPLQQKRDYLLLNASINVFAFEDEGVRMVHWGDVAHLHSDDAAQDDTRPERVPDTRIL